MKFFDSLVYGYRIQGEHSFSRQKVFYFNLKTAQFDLVDRGATYLYSQDDVGVNVIEGLQYCAEMGNRLVSAVQLARENPFIGKVTLEMVWRQKPTSDVDNIFKQVKTA